MKLQVALDFLREDLKPTPKEVAIKVAKEVAEYTDIVEAGCPMNFVEGLQFIRDLRRLFPNKVIYGDLKIWTLEDWEVTQGFEAGADIVQIQAFASDETIKKGVRIARKCKKQIAINFDGYLSAQQNKDGDILKRAIEVDKMGVDYIGILWYTVHDPKYWSLLKQVRKAVNANIAVGGGLTLESLEMMLKEFKPDIIIVGRSIIDSPDPRQAAKAFKERITAAPP